MRNILILLFIFQGIILQAQNQPIPTKIKFDATLKTKYEIAAKTSKARFSVRNSRLGLYGEINPLISYKFQIELSSEGKFDVLDMYGTIKPADGLEFSLGQISIPLYNSYMITPSQMLFANRAFLAKFITPGSRDIGVYSNYEFTVDQVPVALQAGVFNGGLINKPEWTNRPAYAARVIVGAMDGLRASAKVFKYPGDDTTNLFIWGADFRYGSKRFKLEGEVMNRNNMYNNNVIFAASLQSGYSIPISGCKLFKDIIPAIRWDAIGHSFINRGFDVNRLTFGLSFGFTSKPFSSLLRFDYEQYIVRDHIYELTKSLELESSKFTVELLLLF